MGFSLGRLARERISWNWFRGGAACLVVNAWVDLHVNRATGKVASSERQPCAQKQPPKQRRMNPSSDTCSHVNHQSRIDSGRSDPERTDVLNIKEPEQVVQLFHRPVQEVALLAQTAKRRRTCTRSNPSAERRRSIAGGAVLTCPQACMRGCSSLYRMHACACKRVCDERSCLLSLLLLNAARQLILCLLLLGSERVLSNAAAASQRMEPRRDHPRCEHPLGLDRPVHRRVEVYEQVMQLRDRPARTTARRVARARRGSCSCSAVL